MSQENLRKIIIRAVREPEYREALFGEPDRALEGYELTEEEVAALKGLEREKFDAVASEVEERVSRAGVGVEPPDKIALRVLQRAYLW
jgi:hypothetical protein